jgi:CheY-like chemotaxis protein/DNA-binding XRE family transcriptional regulator
MRKGEVIVQFGAAIRSRRRALGISQEELADRAGLHRTYISDIERGERNISLESIEKLAAALESSICTLFTQAGETVSKTAEESPVAPGQCVDILLVEDNPRDVELTLKAFERANIANSIHVVRDGAEALNFILGTGAHATRRLNHRPEVVLLDLKLPKVSGLEVLRRLKADPRAATIPVIVLTESQQSRDFLECQRLGARNYIVKPVDFYRFSEVTSHFSFRWALLKPPPKVTV